MHRDREPFLLAQRLFGAFLSLPLTIVSFSLMEPACLTPAQLIKKHERADSLSHSFIYSFIQVAFSRAYYVSQLGSRNTTVIDPLDESINSAFVIIGVSGSVRMNDPIMSQSFSPPKTSFFSALSLVQNVSLTSVRRGAEQSERCYPMGPGLQTIPVSPEEASSMVLWEARLQSFLVPCEHYCKDCFLTRDRLKELSALPQHGVLFITHLQSCAWQYFSCLQGKSHSVRAGAKSDWRA